MKKIAELILSGGSAEFSCYDEQYLIQQERNKGCHYRSSMYYRRCYGW